MDAELQRQAVILFGNSLKRRPDEGTATHPEELGGGGATPDSAVPALDASPEPATEQVPAAFGFDLTRRQASRLWRHVESIEGFWESLKEIEPGAVARVAAITSKLRWEVIFLTKRPESAGATAQIQSQRWLESNGFSLPSVYVVQGSRGRIAAALALDIVVDDRPENCVDVVSDSMARPILVWRDGNRTVPASATRLGIPVVRSVGECLDILSGIDPSAEKRSVLDRIKGLLGLKSGPTTPPNPPPTRSRSRTPTLN